MTVKYWGAGTWKDGALDHALLCYHKKLVEETLRFNFGVLESRQSSLQRRMHGG